MALLLHLQRLACGQGVEPRYPAAQLVADAGNWSLRIHMRKWGLGTSWFRFRGPQTAIEGCAHGDLDNMYATLQYLESVHNIKIELLICCRDFQVEFVQHIVINSYQLQKNF